MALELTQNARNASLETSKELNIVFEIEGYDQIIGSLPILKEVRIGDEDLIIGDPEINENAFFIGDSNPIANQETLIDLDSTSTNIRQQLQIDKGKSSGVSTFQIAVLDKEEFATKLITPDETQTPTFDVLGRRCTVSLGFSKTNFPEDYVKIFRGQITDIEPAAGTVVFTINSPDNKKRKNIFKQASAELTANLLIGDTVANVDKTQDFLVLENGPSGVKDSNFKTYIQIDNEIMSYETTTSGQIQNLVRGELGTFVADHDAGAAVTSIYQITGNPMDIALKVMSSGFAGPFVEDIEISNFNFINIDDIRSNAIVFLSQDLRDTTGIVVGDYITTSGATNPANDVTLERVTGVEVNEDGTTIITVDGAGFVSEIDSPATMSIRSQYDVFPDGMNMTGDEIDIDQHLFIRNTFMQAFEYDFRIEDPIESGKDWLEEQIYSPVAAFSIPRKARASVGYHIGPIPGKDIKTLNTRNIKNPDKLKIRRSTERFFFNEIVYRYDKKLGEDKFLGGDITIAEDSKARIQNREKALIISSEGLRTINSAANIANISTQRRANRYKFGAEFLTLSTFFSVGFPVEIGDIVLFNGQGLQMSDIKNGSRQFETRLMEVQQKTVSVKTGDIQIQLVDTNFNGQQRFGLISPASKIKSVISANEILIESSFGSRFGDNEFQKYEDFDDLKLRLRSLDFSRLENAEVDFFDGNIIKFKNNLATTFQPGDVIELQEYSSQPREVNLVFGFISENAGDDFADGETSYVTI